MQISILSAACELYAYFSENELSLTEYVNHVQIDGEWEEGLDNEEEKEGEDTDEKEYDANLGAQNSFFSNLSTYDIHYLHNYYSVTLHITAEPPELV
ncbi:MAG: hypothetical protein ACJAT1_001680 [Marivirga sp.]|jgi:hypothetical protein